MVTDLKLTLTIEHRSVAQRSVTIQQVFHELSCFRSSKEKGWKKTRRKKMTRGKHKKNPLSSSQVVHYMLCCNAGICAPTDLVLLSAAGLTLCDIRACCVDKEGIKQRCFLSQPCLSCNNHSRWHRPLHHDVNSRLLHHVLPQHMCITKSLQINTTYLRVLPFFTTDSGKRCQSARRQLADYRLAD